MAMACHGKDPTDLCSMKAGPGVGHLYSGSPRIGVGGESWEGSLLHLGLPGLVSQGANFIKRFCPNKTRIHM